jgi:biopolymer transport protein ExbD
MKQNLRARRMARLHKRAKKQATLNLVSLMDIFTILVFFLMVNASDVEVLENNKSINLPESISDKKPGTQLVVTVTAEDILVGSRAVAKTASALNQSGETLAPLQEELAYLAQRSPYANDEERQRGRDVTIMGDSAIPYTLLKRIMLTCAQSEYRNIALAVSQLEEKAPDTTGQGG